MVMKAEGLKIHALTDLTDYGTGTEGGQSRKIRR